MFVCLKVFFVSPIPFSSQLKSKVSPLMQLIAFYLILSPNYFVSCNLRKRFELKKTAERTNERSSNKCRVHFCSISIPLWIFLHFSPFSWQKGDTNERI